MSGSLFDVSQHHLEKTSDLLYGLQWTEENVSQELYGLKTRHAKVQKRLLKLMHTRDVLVGDDDHPDALFVSADDWYYLRGSVARVVDSEIEEKQRELDWLVSKVSVSESVLKRVKVEVRVTKAKVSELRAVLEEEEEEEKEVEEDDEQPLKKSCSDGRRSFSVSRE